MSIVWSIRLIRRPEPANTLKKAHIVGALSPRDNHNCVCGCVYVFKELVH